MNAKKKVDFYSTRIFKTKLDMYFGKTDKLDKKIAMLQVDLDQGFELFNRIILDKFLQGHDDISDFGEQFIKLNVYRENNNKFKNTEELSVILYGEPLGKMKWAKKIESISGENNPAYQHGGKYSPWSKKSKFYTEESKKKAIRNRSYATRIKYYLDKGMTEPEAIAALKERQQTFTLEKCIESIL